MPETNDRPRGAAKVLGFSPKDRVEHSVFGTGTIVAIDEHRTTIAFDQSGTRKFVTSMVKMTRSETPAPERPVRTKKVGQGG